MKLVLTAEEESRLIAFKQDLHMYPELPHREYETTEKIRSFLLTLPGVEILKLNQDLTGVVARIRGTAPEPPDGTRIREVGLRADIDAIAQTEEYESPYASRRAGVMHACGHDFHTASLLGAAMLLSGCRSRFSGTVDLLFQEAEETTDGAQEMIDAGLFEVIRPEVFFGMHNRPEVEAGKVVCHRGGLMAAKTNFSVCIKGLGGHGANPHLCIDPVVCTAAMIQSLQTVVSRNTDPLESVVLTIGSIHGGSVENLVVDEVTITASIRALGVKAKEDAVKRAEEIILQTAKAYGCVAEISYQEILPMVWNTEKMYELAFEAAVQAVGEENVTDAQPTLASEDFSLIMDRVPSFFYWIGSGSPGDTCYAWHHAKFHTDDRGIRVGALTMAQAALCALSTDAFDGIHSKAHK